MLRRRVWSDDDGNAPLEFILGGLILLVPLVYLVVALGIIQEQSLGVESGARHIARAVATAPDADTARQRADAVARAIADEYGIHPDRLDVAMTCRPAGECPRAGATLVVTIATRASLPLAPAVLGIDRLASVPVSASAAAKISRVWGDG
ncbi:TadE family protein [Microbacterium horticulturae]|uniref:TadE family protein n=1 Tax=Microbacterium horticulturae TaxID=3028316 RepID=A0ABY8BTH0_9MICO|nr:TadE family protein [Microbacterium sp. KACC 23027]WEG07461.1 TadE family protein [Microbacterium sp. KACC 23027]